MLCGEDSLVQRINNLSDLLKLISVQIFDFSNNSIILTYSRIPRSTYFPIN